MSNAQQVSRFFRLYPRHLALRAAAAAVLRNGQTSPTYPPNQQSVLRCSAKRFTGEGASGLPAGMDKIPGETLDNNQLILD